MSARATVRYKGNTIIVSSNIKIHDPEGYKDPKCSHYASKHKSKQEAMAVINTIFSDRIDKMLAGEIPHNTQTVSVGLRQDAEVDIE